MIWILNFNSDNFNRKLTSIVALGVFRMRNSFSRLLFFIYLFSLSSLQQNNNSPLNPNIDLLLELKENIKNSVSFIEKYIDQASTCRIENEKERVAEKIEIEKRPVVIATHEIGVQANLAPVKPAKKQMRNKKLQVDLSSKIASFNSNNNSNNSSNNSNSNNRSLEKNPSPVTDKSTTPTSLTSRRNVAVQSVPTTCSSVGVQCMLTPNQDPSSVSVVTTATSKSDVLNAKKTTTTATRRPLAVISGNQVAHTPVVS